MIYINICRKNENYLHLQPHKVQNIIVKPVFTSRRDFYPKGFYWIKNHEWIALEEQ